AQAQEPGREVTLKKSATLASPAAARILGKIPDGTPPPPAPPKPEFHIPARDILSTATHEQGGRTITIRQIKPIALQPPPIPPAPAKPAALELDEEFSQRLADYHGAHPRAGLLFLGATVFRSKDSPPRTLVRYWPEGTGETITFWSSADFALIAGGIQSFADSAGDTHHLLMGWSHVDIDRMSRLEAAQGREYDAPALPDLPKGKATFQIIGEAPAAEERVVIQSLHDIYNNELARLKTAHAGREKARIQRQASLKANPPRPENITLNYWRTEKPSTHGREATQ
ncbi:MAG: hypothetical protein WED15_02355, partial [Akkermansiaceae bacterium]